MILDTTASTARRYLPTKIFKKARVLGTVCLTPLVFTVRTGHAISALFQKALDRERKPIPWLTYPAVDLLRSKNLSGKSVLEFGSGQSTLWFAERCASVLSFESNPEWHAYVSRQLPPSAAVHLVSKSLDGAHAIIGARTFDIVVVDGFERHSVCEWAQQLVAPHGAIIFDDSEGYAGEDRTYPIIRSFRQAGFRRVDLYGMAPGVVRPHCTSILFRDDCFLFAGDESPRRYQDE